MNTEIITTKTIFPQLQCFSSEEVIEILSSRLFEVGIVTDTYYEAVIERELKFPTGLNVAGNYKVAIPHTDITHVNCPGIAFASLPNPVKWGNIENPEEKIGVQLVFLLAIQTPEEQVHTLQHLMGLFSDLVFLTTLFEETNPQKIQNILNEKLK